MAHRLQGSLHPRSPAEQGVAVSRGGGLAKLDSHGAGPGRSLGAGTVLGGQVLASLHWGTRLSSAQAPSLPRTYRPQCLL